MKKPLAPMTPDTARAPLPTARTDHCPNPPPQTPATAAAPPSREEPDGTKTEHAEIRLHTAEQASVLLQVPASWLRKKAAAGHIPCTKIGRHLRFSQADLTHIIRSGARSPQPNAST
ncbi:helix-turn-helix domain-containing protein [Wenjunlia tyrosinilytica]